MLRAKKAPAVEYDCCVLCGEKTEWWQCSEGHIWRAVIHSRAGPQKCGCPVCAGKIKESKQHRYDDILAEQLLSKK